uniref:t-SNARE coiled-coil homology domain-containing protein n=1 Tax=Rhodosorus marinus TaxID=101924 RepID=A0A7S2ZBV7_9RHOD
MAVRSRTALFVRFREDSRRSFAGKVQQTGGSDAGTGDGLVELELVDLDSRPEFLTLHDQLRKHLDIVDKRVQRLTDLHAKRLLPGFAEENAYEQDEEIQDEAERITKEIHACEVAVRRIPASSNNRVWASMQKTFAADLQNVTLKFRTQQKHYLRNLEKQRDLVNSALIQQKNSQLVMLDDDPGENANGGFSQEQLLEVQQVDLHLDERNQEIDRIASSIQDLATVMKDMSQLVIEQGTVLDRIDYNIEESQFKTQEATEQLRQAERYQRRGISFAIVMCLLLGCFIMGIIVILKLFS